MKKSYLIILFLSIGFQTCAQNFWFYPQEIDFQKEIPTISLKSKLSSNFQVSDLTFSKLIFNDLNYLILGDDSPQEGISYEYNQDVSSLKLSGYLSSFKWNDRENGFLTIDGEFKTKNGIYFFDKEKGGTQAKVTGNVFFTLKSYRSYNNLFSKEGDKPGWNKARQQAYIRANYRKIQLLQDLYTKYSTLSAIAKDVDYPIEDFSIQDTLLENAKPYLNDFEIEFDFTEDLDFDLSDYKSKYAIESKNEFQNKVKLIGKDKRLKKKQAKANGENFDSFKVDETKNVDIKRSTYNLSKIFTDLEDLKNKIDSVAFALEEIEMQETQKIWKSKHLWYIGISPFYVRETLEVFSFNEEVKSSDQFITNKKDLVGINTNINYFFQSREWLIKRFYLRANIEVAKSSNFADLTLSKIRVVDSVGVDDDGNMIEVVTEKNAYNGTKNYLSAFKTGVSIEGYIWVLNDFGIFTKIGYNNYNLSGEETKHSDELPWRFGFLYEFKNSKKPGKIAVLQAFLDRNDLQNHPQAKDQNLRFGFKVGIPINIKNKL